MAKQTIDIGSAANDGTGDDLRTGATKINQNFDELYTDVATLQATTGSSITGISFDSGRIVFEGATADSFETTFRAVDPTKDNLIGLPDSSGTVALTADITSIVDSAYIARLTGTAFDSGSTKILIDEHALDSGRAIRLIDSTYVQLRQIDYLDSANVIHLIDSDYVNARATNSGLSLGTDYIDSGLAIVLIDENALDSGRAISLIDSSHVRLRADSDYVKDIIDSAHVIGKAAEIDLRTYTVATAPTGKHGKMIFVDDGASGNPCLAVFDSDAGFYKRIALGAQIST